MTVRPRSELPPPSQPWGRSVDERISSLERSVTLSNVNLANTILQLNSSVQLLSEQVSNLPLPVGYFAEQYGFGLAGPIRVQQTIIVPAGKTRVVFTAVGNVAAVDMTSGGVAVASAYIEANGPGFIWSSPQVPASKDSGASAVNNIISPVLGFEQGSLTPGSNFLVSMTITASNPSAFPPNAFNFGTVALTAIFFN